MVVETYQLTKQYGNKLGCEKICLSVTRGQIFGLLGPNGAGKSTLVKMLVGLLFPSSGSAQVLGQPLGDLKARRKIGYLPENFRYQPWLTGEELLSFHGSLSGMGKAELRSRTPQVLAQVGLEGKGRQRVGTYSKGMQQRMGLACALLPDPDLIFLDEPTSALDPLGRRQVREILLDLRAKGKSVFLNSHLLSEVEMICDRVEIIKGGRIIAGGSLQELLTQTIVVRLQIRGLNELMLKKLAAVGTALKVNGDTVELNLDKNDKIPQLAEIVLQTGGELFALERIHSSLEDLYVELMQSGGGKEC